MAYRELFVLILCLYCQFAYQVHIPKTFPSELPPDASIPRPNATEVISEEFEPDRNRTSIIQWFLEITGLGTTTTVKPILDPIPVNCPACTCGITNKNHRIVGGEETVSNEYPWMVLLKYRNTFYCGGSLICNKYVITAAHCVNGFQKERITASFFVHDRTNFGDMKIYTRQIKYIHRHAKYNSRNYDNDIALLKLDGEIPMKDLMRPVCLPETGKSFTGKPGIATGWGATSEGGPLAQKLQEVTVDIMSNNDCKKTGYGTNRITENMLCAGFPEGQKDSCQGDSGGPLHVVDGTTHSLVGVVSWGDGCAQANYPGVYTRVNRYVTWIKSNTKDCCYCTNSNLKQNVIKVLTQNSTIRQANF